ncbi:MAG: hypothetical protein AB8C02_12250 [Halioglobus sp.]
MANTSTPLKVVQWTSGGVAREAIRAIQLDPKLELVGLYAFSEEKKGIDAGELAGLPPMGVSATTDINALIALQPDCVSYSPLYPNIDHLVALLEAGINVVTTCNFITGWGLNYRAGNPQNGPRERIHQAALKGGASIFGTGINPGHINYTAAVLAAHCVGVRHVKVTESVDVFNFVGDKNMTEIGFGLPANSPDHAQNIKQETAVFGDAIELMAKLLKMPIDAIDCEVEFAYATAAIDAPGRPIAPGCVAGVSINWKGMIHGNTVLENEQIWVAGENTDAPWRIQHGYILNVQGDPNLHNVMLPIPVGDITQMTPKAFNAVGMRITALPSINAIPAVCAAAAGIQTYCDLPPIGGSFAPA